jgi:hypothetical protein
MIPSIQGLDKTPWTLNVVGRERGRGFCCGVCAAAALDRGVVWLEYDRWL